MATRLKKLEITKVDLCKNGADPDAHIEIFKSRGHEDPENHSDEKETEMSKKFAKIDLAKATPEEVVAYAKSLEDQLEKAAPPAADDGDEDDDPKAKPAKKAMTGSAGSQVACSVPDDVKKTMDDQAAEIAKTKKDNEDLRQEIAKEREAREIATIEKSVMADMPKVPGTVTEIAKALHEIKAKTSKETFEFVEKVFKAGSVAIEKAEKEIGGTGVGASATALDEIEKSADELIAKDAKLTRSEAITKVAEANPALYQRYKDERNKR
jgi:hypothetical protein